MILILTASFLVRALYEIWKGIFIVTIMVDDIPHFVLSYPYAIRLQNGHKCFAHFTETPYRVIRIQKRNLEKMPNFRVNAVIKKNFRIS